MEEKKGKNGGKNPMVFYRLKPSKDFSYENIKVQDDFKVVHAKRVQDCSPNIFNEPLYLGYKCESVFYRHPQLIVYTGIMRDVLARAVEGCDATIIAHGQTGSGKTQTMTGLRNPFSEMGIVPRFLAEMFEQQSKLVSEFKIVYRMSFVELIEPADVRDLLVSSDEKKVAKLKYEDKLKNASRLVIPSATDALRLLFKGESQRRVVRTAAYPGANLSHTVLTIYIEATSLIKSNPVVHFGKINFVDMMGTNCAGNERCHLPPRSQGQANLAKMLLEQYFTRMNGSDSRPLSQNWTSIVIDYLGESLNRQAIMRVIGHIHGSASDLEVTHSTLRFGAVVGAVRAAQLVRHVETDSVQQKINELADLACLSQHRAMLEASEKEWLLNNGEEPLSIERVAHLRRLASHYLLGEVPIEVVIGLNQMSLFLELCMEHVESMQQEALEDAVFMEALKKEEEAVMYEKMLMAERDSLSSRTRSSLKGSGSKSQESQKSIGTISKEGSSKSKSKKSIEKVKRDTSQTSKKSKSSSRNARASFGTSPSGDTTLESETPLRNVPSRSAGWAMFMVNGWAKEMQDDVRDAEIADREASEEYEETKSIVMEASQSLEEVRKELFLTQKLRKLRSKETLAGRGAVLACDKEKMMIALCDERESELNKQLEAMHSQKLLKSETAKRLNDARREIEEKYQAFCIANYGVPTPGGLEEFDNDSCLKVDKSFELSYYNLQNSTLLHLKTTSRQKRRQSFYSEKCFSEDLPFKNSLS